MVARIIQSLTELKSLASENPVECYIKLKHGAKSNKMIQYFPSGMKPDEREDIDEYKWDIYSSISDEYLEIQDDVELEEETHLIEAIKQNALILYER